MIRTGVYGGTFNPIHLGHVSLCRKILQDGLVDELWLLVSPQNPFKVNDTLLSDSARLEMASAAVADEKGITASDYEFSLPRPSYMYNTLQSLSKAYPNREFILIIGADNWNSFHLWHRYEDILSRYHLIVYPRPGYDISGEMPDNITIADTPLLDISSTAIRTAINSPSYDGRGLHPKVWEIIRKNNYYRI